MKELLTMIGCLYLLVLVNILLGMVYKINLKKFKFDKYKLLGGVVKGLAIGFAFVSLNIVWMQFPSMQESFGVAPTAILSLGIAYYFGKCALQLKNIVVKEKELKEGK